MVKRPLCLFVLLWMAALRALGAAGLLREEGPPKEPALQACLNQRVRIELYGEVERWEDYDAAQYLYLKHAILPDSGKQIPLEGVKVKTKEKQAWRPGNLVRARGFLTLSDTADNPGQFDRRSYDKLRGVDYVLEEASAALYREQRDLGACLLLEVKEWLKRGISRTAPEPEAGLLKAMLLGEKKEADEELKLLYQISSISHLMAVSGLHVSLLGGIFRRILEVLGFGARGAAAGAFLLLLPYAFLVGGSVSALRAVILFGVAVGARILGRTYDILSALALAAFLILLENPAWMYDSSFLLSFGAVLGITQVRSCLFPGDEVFGEKPGQGRKRGGRRSSSRLLRRMRDGLSPLGARLGMVLGEGAKAGIALWLTTLPIVLYFFYEVSLYGILLNLFLIPTAGAVLGCGLAGSLLGGTGWLAFLGRAAAIPAVALLRLYEQAARLLQSLPYPTVILGRPGWAGILCYYLLLAALCLLRKRGKKGRTGGGDGCGKSFRRGRKSGSSLRVRLLRRASPFLLLPLAAGLLTFRPGTGVEVAMLDVGQGDGLVIETGWGSCYLVDGGSTSEYGAGKYRILPFLKYKGIRRVDLCILTHPDADHCNGMLELLRMAGERETSLKIGGLLLPAWMRGGEAEERLLLAAEKAGAKVRYAKAGDSLTDRELTLAFLHPDEGDYSRDPNGGSLSFLLTYKGRKGLFTGDITGEQEGKLLEAGSCDFLKVAHHGSASSTGEEFLRSVSPRLALISSGEGNSYGHPAKETLKRLEEAAVCVLNTQELGAVWLKLGEKKLEVNSMHPGGKYGIISERSKWELGPPLRSAPPGGGE